MPSYKNLEADRPLPSFKNIFQWKVTDALRGRNQKHPDRIEVPRVTPDLRRLRALRDNSVTWVGHATYLVQLAGRSILTDPVLGERIAVIPRIAPIGVEPASMPTIDAVTISHNHRDHLDIPSIRSLGKGPTYLVPMGLKKMFESLGMPKVIELNWWESAEVEGVTYTFVPAHHWSRRGAFDQNKTLWGGWVMRGGGRTVWHTGDTAYFGGFSEIGRRAGPIDAALLPIGAYEPRWFMKNQHMNPDDAVKAFQDSGAHLFCAMHWGTFKLTDEPLDEPPKMLLARWEEQNLPQNRLFLAKLGESYWL
jgi:L-ascorbate metabolism protein UlaG (beta-lactamase superfamily)